MVLMVDTTTKHTGKAIAEELLRSGETAAGFELIDTTGLHISHCAGCNYCWLKTPGVCAIQDDYEPILRKMSRADQVWLVSDTHFGFVSWQTKNIVPSSVSPPGHQSSLWAFSPKSSPLTS